MSKAENGDDLLTVGQARELLGVSKAKMAELLRKGTIPAMINPLSRREKLVRRADLEPLKREYDDVRSHMARASLAVAY